MNLPASAVEINSYDRIIILLSGGKDSIACLLKILELGADPAKIELHHHLVDGRESHLFDWPITEAYCEAVAGAFGIPLSYSWKVGGLLGELQRNNQPTAPISIPDGAGGQLVLGGNGPLGTRLKFPQQSASLTTRYCSGYAKIDPFNRWLCNDKTFEHSRTLVITGERAQESANRANYAVFEPHKADRRSNAKLARHVDHYRVVHSMSENDVWDIIQNWSLSVHPCYWLGWSRASCRLCVFNQRREWAKVRVIAPAEFKTIVTLEKASGLTINRQHSVEQQADAAEPFELDPYWVALANSRVYTHPIFEPEWKLPPGAYSGNCGPT
ncbi:phosphoadenosine phosphosulfate reductase family protein [Acidovorax delafieldii]|uniref:phosphoadenosine phosphosulfate reductase domain-containing protein n=1 Tax=Acidovorax delafieldii TaxID=47920 RepID=UPI003ED12272